MTTIYTVGDGKRTQFAKRDEDGMWFIRTKYRDHWAKWMVSGKQRPFDFGVYAAPGVGCAKLPPLLT